MAAGSALTPYTSTRMRAATELGIFLSVAYAVRRQLHRLRDGGD
jgi:hypothetical protein